MGRIYDEQGPDKFVPVSWYSRSGSMYVTSEAMARAGYYAVNAYPWTYFDGLLSHRGAYTNNETQYQWYMSSFNIRQNVNPPVAITFLQKQYANGKVMVKVEVEVLETISSGHVCHFVLWEDKVANHYRFVERAYAPENVTVTGKGEKQEITHEFTIQSGWEEANLGLSVFVQDPTGKEVKNGRAGMLESAYAVSPTSVGRVKALFR